MTRLRQLRSNLAALRRRRGTVRALTGLSALVIGLLWVLGAVFLLDLVFETTVLQRLVVFAVAGAILVWVCVRFTAPWFGVSESQVDMALLVERQQQIDSDLVAALQFESPEAPGWGSVQLEDAVVDRVGQFSHGLNVYAGMDYSAMWRRGLLALVTIALAIAVAALFPAHARVFLARLLLSREHYPTATVIESLAINGTTVPISPSDRTVVRIGFGQQVTFAANCSGEIPPEGQITLRSSGTGKKSPVALAPVGEGGQQTVFQGQLDRLLDSVTYKIYLGDAWTDPREISLIRLPVVQPRLQITPPAYANTVTDSAAADAASLQQSVLESSRIDVQFESSKLLQQAHLTVEAGGKTFEYDLSPVGDDSRRWVLGDRGTPFEEVVQPIRFALQVTDEDDLQLESPLKGFVRIKTDRRPQVMGDLVHRVVLPDAAPVIELRASDDYGIAELTMNVQIVRTRDKPGMEGMSEQTVKQERIPITSVLKPASGRENGNGNGNGVLADTGETRLTQSLQFPIRGELLPIVGGFRLSLAPLQLLKGDQLRLTLEALDDRGDLPGRLAESEPLILDVSDESGVLAAISEADETSEARITEIIRRQLGIGESP